MFNRLRFWLLLLALLVPGAVLIGQQWLLGTRLATLEVHERDSRVRRAVDQYVTDMLAAYRAQNETILRRIFDPLDTMRKLQEPVPATFDELKNIRRELGRPAALFIAVPRGNVFEIRYFALDESDEVREFAEPAIEPIHRAILGYVHSMMSNDAFRNTLRERRIHETSEYWPFGAVHFFHAPVFFDDPVVPRAYVGMWESLDFATRSFLLTFAQQHTMRFAEQDLDPSRFRWTFHAGDGQEIFRNAPGDGVPILEVRLGAYGPMFEQLTLSVATLPGLGVTAERAVQRQRLILLVFAGLSFLAAAWLLTRSAMRDRWLARLHRDFVGRISHELKTPVAAAINAVDSLSNPKLTDKADVATFANILRNQLRSLAALLERLIDVSRLEEGAVPIAPRELDIAAHLKSHWSQLCASVGLSETAVKLDGEERLIAWVDPTALELVIRNLLENTVKYANAGDASQPPVIVSCQSIPTFAVVSVRDFGPGLPKREWSRVFRAFYRVGDDMQNHTPGHGLGLALVHSLVKAHGGDARVENAPGGGCLFTVRWPTAF